MQDIKQLDYQRFKLFLEQACGILLGEDKQYLVSSRLRKLLREEKIATLADLMQVIERGQPPHLRDSVIDAMTTNETSWFRDGAPFEVLSQVLFPQFEQTAKADCRIWSAACSSGQEPYTISMLISEYLGKIANSKLATTQIMATDISTSMLNQAQQGLYESSAIQRGLTDARCQQFFKPVSGQWALAEQVKQRVNFSVQNLLSSYALLGRFDVIFCRNVLIYFSAQRKSDILLRMARALKPGGYLFLGASETITGYSDQFDLVRSPQGVFYRCR